MSTSFHTVLKPSVRILRDYSRVDDGREDFDTSSLDSNDEWRSRSTSTCTPTRRLSEQLGVRVDNHTDNESTNDVEEQDSVEGLSNSGRDGLSGVLKTGSAKSIKWSRGT